MRIAIIGTGIAGNVVAWRLQRRHDITVYEANDYIGGHTNTIDVAGPDGDLAIDTGFIVFNDRTYPHFRALLSEIGVRSQPSDMSFSLSASRPDFEYCGSSRRSRLFAQPRNLLRPWFYRMLSDILRFNEAARRDCRLGGGAAAITGSIGEYLAGRGYSDAFIRYYLLPMAAAVWSGRPDRIDRMPAEFLLQFFDNHGLLDLRDRPTWEVIEGGSRRYVERLTAPFADRIRLNCAVRSVRRDSGQVVIAADGCEPERFDRVFIACHSDDALGMLADPSGAEREILGAIRYQDNDAVLHTDTSLLPRRPRAWAAWNYLAADEPGRSVAVTYNMNILQNIGAPQQYCVTLNSSDRVDPGRVLYQTRYRHPVFDAGAVAAQRRRREINGPRATYYCGAYWRYGFHEDGVVSALDALADFEDDEREQLHLRRSA